MPGSRKGERRGGAKPGRIRKAKLGKTGSPMKRGGGTGVGRAKGTGNKSKFDPKMGVILNKQATPLRREQELEMYFIATGKRMRLPKEVMLDAMRYFEEMGIDWADVVRENMRLLAGAQSDEARDIYERAIEFAETRVREHILMAVDVAYKAAPYLHPRLAALITNPGADQSPLNAISQLFKDLDEAGLTGRYIDHDPNEVPK